MERKTKWTSRILVKYDHHLDDGHGDDEMLRLEGKEIEKRKKERKKRKEGDSGLEEKFFPRWFHELWKKVSLGIKTWKKGRVRRKGRTFSQKWKKGREKKEEKN